MPVDSVLSPTTPSVTPHTPDLPAIVSSTRDFLDLIVQVWDTKQNVPATGSGVAQETRTHIQKFVGAFDTALRAAQDGHDAASEGLTWAQYTAKPDADKSTKQQYMKGMIRISEEGKNRSENALKGFREAKQGIAEALKRIQPDAQEAECRVLNKNLEVLNGFEELMAWYAHWWTEKNMEESGQHDRIKNQGPKPTSIGMSIVARKWEVLKDGYSSYTEKMHEIQDSYPAVLPRLDPEKTIQSGVGSRGGAASKSSTGCCGGFCDCNCCSGCFGGISCIIM